MTGEVIDISRTIQPGALVYPGDPPLEMQPLCRIGPGAAFNMLRLSWTTHILTHLDAPLHFLEGGSGVDRIPPRRLIGKALVVEVNGPSVQPEHIPPSAKGLNLLFRTRHSGPWNAEEYDSDHVYISRDAAEAMADREVNLGGIDYLSVDRFGDEEYPAHRILLGRGVLILEGLDLSAAPAGSYTLVALPLKIAAGDGSPVRAVLIREPSNL